MDKTPLYQQIAESVREDILYGRLRPGDPLPTIRDMAQRWHCTPGTVQQAYRDLARQHLVDGRPGQGTWVKDIPAVSGGPLLRRATLLHRAESFLLEVLTAGYSPAEVEDAVRVNLDRWRVLASETAAAAPNHLRFVGSHDPAISRLADRLAALTGNQLDVVFAGSLGGLMSLAAGDADLAGCHLWDSETDTYNVPFVQRLLPGRAVTLITLAHRHLGLLVRPGNPLHMHDLFDLTRPGVRFINRQTGAGTRVWLDVQLSRHHIERAHIAGYAHEVPTHTDIGRALLHEEADAGIGIATIAQTMGLDFVPLTAERYDLVMRRETWETPAVQALAAWLASADARMLLESLGGYETQETGRVQLLAT